MRKEYGSEFQLDMEALVARPRASAFEFPEGRARFFRAGRDAIRHLARIERDRCGGVDLLPSLCCDSMSEPFVLEGYEVVFFAVDEDLRIDEEGLAEKAGENPGSLLLYMSYFGIAPFAGRFAEEVKERFGLTVVRDATHDFLGRGIEGGAADYVVASLRKWAALPDGAILYSRHRDLGNGRLGVDDDFVARRRDAMTAKQRYLEGDDGVSKEGYLASLAECNAVLDAMGEPCEMSAVSSDILARTDWAAVRDLRKRNASLLTLRFEKAGLRCYCDISTPPLYVPIVLENRDTVQRKLSSMDVYCPVLWPLPEGAEGCGGFAGEFSSRMLAIPCDQRYQERDIEFIADSVIDVICGE